MAKVTIFPVSDWASVITLTIDTRKKGSLLDGRRLLKAIGIDDTGKGIREVHVIKAINCLIPVTLNEAFGVLSHWGHCLWIENPDSQA